MKRQAQAVLLPMEKEGQVRHENTLCVQIERNKLCCIVYNPYDIGAGNFIPQQLIIVDDSEIKVGLPYMMWFNKKWELMNPCIDQLEYVCCNDDKVIGPCCKAIVCAYPTIANIPPIFPSFIKAFADANGKGEVWVEYARVSIYRCDSDSEYESSETMNKFNKEVLQLDTNGYAVLELREEKKLEEVVPTKAEETNHDVAVMAYNSAMDEVMAKRLSLFNRDIYRSGYYNGFTDCLKSKPTEGSSSDYKGPYDVNYFLTNILRHLDNEQMKVLADSVYERCGADSSSDAI